MMIAKSKKICLNALKSVPHRDWNNRKDKQKFEYIIFSFIYDRWRFVWRKSRLKSFIQ